MPIFSQEDRVNARRIAPYLCTALDRALAREDASQKDTAINSILSGLPHRGIMLMDQNMEPAYVSDTARSILSLLSSEPNCRRTAAGLRVPKQLYQQMEKGKRALVTGKRPEATERRFEFPIKNKAHHISARLQFMNMPQQRAFFVLILESSAPELAVTQDLRKIGLSKREIEVVFPVCEGLSNAQISEKLFISEYTVINHIRSIYEKLGVGNRTSLAHYVNTLLLRFSGVGCDRPTGCLAAESPGASV
jgi:ATP/maltotriose-dependent transcriptional regulator MalT